MMVMIFRRCRVVETPRWRRIIVFNGVFWAPPPSIQCLIGRLCNISLTCEPRPWSNECENAASIAADLLRIGFFFYVWRVVHPPRDENVCPLWRRSAPDVRRFMACNHVSRANGHLWRLDGVYRKLCYTHCTECIITDCHSIQRPVGVLGTGQNKWYVFGCSATSRSI